MTEAAFKKYYRTVLIVVYLALLAVGTRSVLVDPYWLFQKEPAWVERFGGHNRILDTRMRHVKSLQVITRQPEKVILGSSRVYRGFDTSNGALSGYYNMGISSLRIAEAEAYVHHLVKWTPVKELVLGLDYFMFDRDETTISGFDPEVGSWKYLLAAFPASLLTKQAFEDASAVQRGERAGDGVWKRDGFKTTNARDTEAMQRILSQFIPHPTSDMQYLVLDDLLAEVESGDIDLKVYLSPVSGDLLNKMHELGSLNAFNTWRKRVREIVEQHGYTLHDFSVDTPFSDEEVTKISTENWIDPMHFQPKVGAWIIQSIY